MERKSLERRICMKVYNVKNVRGLCEKLTGCEGAVELVKESGEHVRLTDGAAGKELSLIGSIYGEIRQMELIFQKPEDCSRIMYYLMNQRGTAA